MVVYTLAVEQPADALPSPLAARRASRFVDSWGNARSGRRRHEGIDIFAPKDTPGIYWHGAAENPYPRLVPSPHTRAVAVTASSDARDF